MFGFSRRHKRTIRRPNYNIDINKNNSKDNNIEDNIKFVSWIQEFSKKVVFITFIIFIIANVFYLWIILSKFVVTNEISFLDTFISEMHNTFREVIGGYIVKAAVENAIKIGGNYIKGYLNSKLELENKKLGLRYHTNENNTEDTSSDDFDIENLN